MEKSKIKVYSRAFAVYFMYVVWIVCLEVEDILCFAAGLQQTSAGSRIVAAIMCGLAGSWFVRHTEIKRVHLTWQLVAGILFISVIGILKGVFPDTSYDTGNYHLIAQHPGFQDYFTQHFGKGSFQVWGFRLGDRIFSAFRSLLGYRMGTLPNLLVMLIAYLQIYGILEMQAVKKAGRVSRSFCNPAVWSLVIILSYHNIFQLGTYYVDLLAFPIGLEVLRKLLETFEKDQMSGDILYFAFLNGIWFAFKMTNVVFVIPCVIMYIIRVRRRMSAKVFCASGVLAALPCVPYIIYSFLCTENPIFPYYNAFFQSEYFGNINFKDTRWGGTSFFERICWLFYMVFKPDYRQGEDYDRVNFIFILGIVGLLFFIADILVKVIKKHYVFDKITTILLLILASSALWGITTGYARYFLWGMLLLGVLAYCFADRVIRQKGLVVVGCLLGVLSLVGMGATIKRTVGEGILARTGIRDAYVNTLSRVFRDKDYRKSLTTDIDMFYLTDSYYGGIGELLAPNIYMFNATFENFLDGPELVEEALEAHDDLLNGTIYDIKSRRLGGMKDYIDVWNYHGMYVEEFQTLNLDIGTYELIKLLKADRDCNVIYYAGDDICIEFDSLSEEAQISFICGSLFPWEAEACELLVLKETGETMEEIYRRELSKRDIETYNINVGTVDPNTKIRIEFYYAKGAAVDQNEANRLFIMNVRGGRFVETGK